MQNEVSMQADVQHMVVAVFTEGCDGPVSLLEKKSCAA